MIEETKVFNGHVDIASVIDSAPEYRLNSDPVTIEELVVVGAAYDNGILGLTYSVIVETPIGVRFTLITSNGDSKCKTYPAKLFSSNLDKLVEEARSLLGEQILVKDKESNIIRSKIKSIRSFCDSEIHNGPIVPAAAGGGTISLVDGVVPPYVYHIASKTYYRPTVLEIEIIGGIVTFECDDGEVCIIRAWNVEDSDDRADKFQRNGDVIHFSDTHHKYVTGHSHTWVGFFTSEALELHKKEVVGKLEAKLEAIKSECKTMEDNQLNPNSIIVRAHPDSHKPSIPTTIASCIAPIEMMHMFYIDKNATGNGCRDEDTAIEWVKEQRANGVDAEQFLVDMNDHSTYPSGEYGA